MQSQTITFPISFSKSCYHVTWMAISSVTNAYKASGYVNSVTRNSFYATADNINCQKYWLAIGVQQWGNSNAANRDTTVTFPIAFSVLYSVVGVPKSSSNLSGSNSNFGVKSQNNKSFVANMYDSGNGYAGFNWCAFGKDQALPMDIHQNPAQPLALS